ncbi:unnamed protein product [Rotaria sp. Silwood2]|nr:unnamed protein product [Rotaria sp. Silwood2]CAF3277329.1 unnamed protein product [Rotaria sp. Silwood2]CAF3353169.1 unnamed protein product [Rotaria sp. Silwood2]CAF4010954.1 unnamed protein product [Rotaria sp. Silwood2]CAF4148066.1 unnamed protein product [Rotaria sp. Silwood2]
MNELMTTIVPNTKEATKIKNSSISMDETIQKRLEKVPIYLRNEYNTFQSIIDQALHLIPVSISKDDIQDDLIQISILIYKINLLSIYHSLWTTYWKSGVGQLIEQTSEQSNYVVYSMNIPIWPKEIKRIITAMNEKNANIHTSPMELVCYHRQQLEKQLRETQIEWNEKVNHLSGYNLKVEHLLENYINEHLHELLQEIEHKKKLVTYDYHIEAIKQEFLRLNPTEYDKKLMKQSCFKKNEEKTTERELQFLEERMNHSNISDPSLERSTITPSSIINFIENTEIRQQIYKQYRHIIEQAKADFCTLSLKTAQEQHHRAKLNYDNQVAKMFNLHHNSNNMTTLPLKMIDLIIERCRIIGERIQFVYQYKIECFHSKSKIKDDLDIQ